MKGCIDYSRRSELHPMGNHGSFRDLKQEEEPRLVGNSSTQQGPRVLEFSGPSFFLQFPSK